ncbi:MAG: hypothetical protein AWU54_424 [Candidatus Frackibacter sp. T328-2]|nr:MAG: hypothetical protein AWU54_424 [Candidatus Frackibacter sp. T328-2]
MRKIIGIDLEGLESKFEIAKKYNETIILSVKVKDYPKLENIIVPPENIDKKLNYIKSVYDKDLNHKRAEGIEIVAVNSYNREINKGK